ncbi:MAG: hypothetical protein SGPRY_003283 [Prymnesium sp.]
MAALLRAAHAWRAESCAIEGSWPEVVVLCCEVDAEGGNQGIPHEWRPLIDALRSRGVRVGMRLWTDETVDWEAVARQSVALPLLTWDYAAQPLKFRRFLAQMVASRCEPIADLRAIEWIMHKRYLLQLSELGVPSPDAALLSATGRRPESDALPVEPALGSRGDGVELLIEGDAGAEEHLMQALESQDMLLQPFLEQVRHEGELCFVFINGELLHAVRKDPTSWGRGARIDEDVVVPDEIRSGELRTHPSVNQPVQLLRTPPAAALNIAEQAISYMQAPQGFDYASRVPL